MLSRRARHRIRRHHWRRKPADAARPRRSADAIDRAHHGARQAGICRPRPRCGNHRAGQLHRAARRYFGCARYRACRRQAGVRGDHAIRLCGSASCRGRYSSGDCRDRSAPWPSLSAGVRPGRPRRLERAARAVKRGGAGGRCSPSRLSPSRLSPLPPCRLGGAIDCRAAPPGTTAPLRVDPRDAPNIDWVARMGAVLPEGQSPPKPQYLRAPDAQPQNAAQLPRR